MIKQCVILSITFLLANGFISAQQYSTEADSARILALSEVVVTGTFAPRALKNTPVLTKVISAGDINASGATTLTDALENFIPGVTFTPNQAMGDNIQIQGLDNKYILILIDGERLVGERTEKVNLSRLNLADVKQVEIITGAASALYGSNAIGSVVNIITRDVDKPFQGNARIRRSNYLNVVDASVGFMLNKISSRTSFSGKDMNTYKVKNTGYTANPYEDISLSQVFGYKTGKINVELKGNYFNQENWLLDKNQTRVDENYTLGAKLQYVFSSNNALTFSANSDNYAGKLVYKLINDSSLRANSSQYSSVRLTDMWNVTDNIHILGGTELNLENVFSYNQFDTQGKKYASNFNLFAQGEFKTETGLEALIGTRYMNHSQFGSYLSPNISLIYRINKFRFRGNIGNGFKTPTLKELYMEFPHYIGDNLPFWVVGNKSLSPEESWYKAVSSEYDNSRINASITLYDNSIHNKINTLTVFNTAANRTEMKYENIEEVRVSGLDLALQYDISNAFRIKCGYAFADAVDKKNNQQISGNSKHTATANLFFKQKNLPFLKAYTKWNYNLLLSFRVMSPRIVYSENNGTVSEVSTGSYYVGNFVYTQNFPIYKDLKGDLQLGINNLFDNVNKDFAAYNPGRTFFAGLGLKF